MDEEIKYQVASDECRKLAAWRPIARWEITKWILLDGYSEEIEHTTMTNEFMGPFTKFLYHFAWLCETGWGVMIDFNEYKQRVYLCDRFYKWMHELREEIYSEMNG